MKNKRHLNPNCRYPLTTRVLNDLMMDVNKGSLRYWLDDFLIHRMHRFAIIRGLYQVMKRTGIQLELHQHKQGGYIVLSDHNFGTSTPPNQFKLMSDTLYRVIETKLDELNFSTSLLNIVQTKYYNKTYNRHFHIRNDGKISYTPKGRATLLNNDGKWPVDGRSIIRTGKAIRQIFSHAYPMNNMDTVVAKIAESIDADYNFTDTLKVVKGQDIAYWYHRDRYADVHELQNSCMKHDHCQDYFTVYTNNVDRVSMLVSVNKDNQLTGRAILWEARRGNDGKIEDIKIMDRIYGKPLTVNAFKTWAHENGYAYKNNQTYQSSNFIAPNGVEIRQRDLFVPNLEMGRQFPYMDTFKYTDDNPYDGTVLISGDDGSYCYSFTCTGGNIDGLNIVEDRDGNEHNEEDCRWSHRFDEWIHEGDAVYCDIDDNWYHADDCHYSSIEDTYIHMDDIRTIKVILPDGTCVERDVHYESSRLVEIRSNDDQRNRFMHIHEEKHCWDSYGHSSIENNHFEYDDKFFGPSPESYERLIQRIGDSDFRQQVLNRYNTYINQILEAYEL